ncbi:MAG: hypothetical protein H7Y22_17730 [Gemmatimonadaceae bacterium]|nr:hypothetical protein [Gloeobacterales cyanobacterium ES-bin-141]
MDTTLQTLLAQAHSSELRSIHTEAAALGVAYVVKATVTLGSQEFSAHAVVDNPLQIVQAETQAIVRALGLAGLDAPIAAPPAFNSGPLYLETQPTELPAPEPTSPAVLIDRERLMEESMDLMRSIQMDPKVGRSYLVQNYSKRSRNELTDEELQSFISYLRTQSYSIPTSKLPF